MGKLVCIPTKESGMINFMIFSGFYILDIMDLTKVQYTQK